MLKRFRRPSPALVIAVVALFLAMAGTGYAGIVIGSKQVKNNSLTSSDIKNGSLLKGDFKSGQIKNGERGANGATGAPGASAFKNLVLVQGPEAALPQPGSGQDYSAVCPAGSIAVSGGYAANGTNNQNVAAFRSYPATGATEANHNAGGGAAWRVELGNTTAAVPDTTDKARAYAICAPGSVLTGP